MVVINMMTNEYEIVIVLYIFAQINKDITLQGKSLSLRMINFE